MTGGQSRQTVSSKIERLGVILQVVVCVATLVPIAWSVITVVGKGLNATLPAWLTTVSVVGAFAGGIFVGMRRRPGHSTLEDGRAVSIIKFDYDRDSLASRGWRIQPVELGETEHRFETIRDGARGKVMEVALHAKLAMDYRVSPADGSRTYAVEYTVNEPDDDQCTLYALTRVQAMRDASTREDLWFQIRQGTEPPELLSRWSGGCEWIVFVKPQRLEGSWQSLMLNLTRAVQETEGRDGWQYVQLDRLRMRGNVTIAEIALHGSEIDANRKRNECREA